MLSTEEFQAIWDEDPIVVIDTNVLLNLYRWSFKSIYFLK